MSADEIRKLAADALSNGIKIRDELLKHAAMVERCEKLLAKYNTTPCEQCEVGEVKPSCPYFVEPNGCNSPAYRMYRNEHMADLNYILRGDAGKEESNG